MLNKRGLSAVVTTLLIILISFVALIILWVVIKNVIEDGSGDVSFERFTVDMNIERAYVENQEVKVDIKRSSGGGDVSGVYFIFGNETHTLTIQRNVSIKELEEEKFTFSSEEVGGIENLETISIVPFFGSVNKPEAGNVLDTVSIFSKPGGGGEQEEEEENSCNGVWDAEDVTEGNECDGGSNCIAVGQLNECTCSLGYTPDGVGGCTENIPCGNNLCEIGENALVCPQDCPLPASCNGVWTSGSGGLPPENIGVECDDPSDPNCMSCICAGSSQPNGVGGCIP